MNKINLKKFIPYGKQFIDRQDISTVGKALQGKLITTGEFVKKFENKIKKKVLTLSTLNKSSVSKIKSKLINYVS